MKKQKQQEPTPELGRAARQLWTFIRPQRAPLVLSIVAYFLASATEPLVPALLKMVLDSGFASTSHIPLWMIPVALIGLFVARGTFFFAGAYLLSVAASRSVMGMRTALMRAVIRADASLYNHLSPSAAVTRVVNNPQDVTGLLGGALTTILRDGLTAVVMMGYLFYLNWRLAALTFVVVPVWVYAIKAVHKRVKSLGTRSYDSQMRLVSVVDDISRAWRVVRTFDAGEWESRRFAAEAQQLQRLTLKSTASNSLMSPLSQVIASFGLAIILTLALLQARQDSATVGSFVAFITAMLLLISKARSLTDVSQPVIAGLITARGCFELLDTPPEPDHGTQELHGFSGHIRFDNVTIAYPGAETPALDGFDVDVPAGKTLALVGASGAGKTTAVSALLGFVAPKGGRILLDGVDVQDLTKASLRKQFAVVSQDIVLFDGSIADNVAYAQPRDDAKIEQCLRAANLWGFVQAEPQGLETQIGANGSRLSGGQRQRLAIARAICKEAPVWIFDEATSALDTTSERVVQRAIEEWQGKKTLVLIAHRLSTVRNADIICVVSAGRVVEAGTHRELMERDGVYAGMVRVQAAD